MTLQTWFIEMSDGSELIQVHNDSMLSSASMTLAVAMTAMSKLWWPVGQTHLPVLTSTSSSSYPDFMLDSWDTRILRQSVEE